MPMSSAQLADLVTRARLKPPQRAVQTRQDKPSPQASPTTRIVPKARTQTTPPKNAAAPPAPPLSSQPEPAAVAAADFPIGWELSKESWHFHRRFYAIFRRPMVQCTAANTPTCSGKSAAAAPSISSTTAGASRCRTADAPSPCGALNGASSPSCPRTGSRRGPSGNMPRSRRQRRDLTSQRQRALRASD